MLRSGTKSDRLSYDFLSRSHNSSNHRRFHIITRSVILVAAFCEQLDTNEIKGGICSCRGHPPRWLTISARVAEHFPCTSNNFVRTERLDNDAFGLRREVKFAEVPGGVKAKRTRCARR